MKKKLLSLFLVFSLFASFTLSASAQALEKQPDGAPSKQELLKLAGELETIFTTIFVKDEITGEYYFDEEAFDNSSYSEGDKASFAAFAQYLNDHDSINAANTFKRCLADALHISGKVLDEFVGYVEKEQWIAAAGILAVAGIVVNPFTVFVFAMNCGAGSAG